MEPHYNTSIRIDADLFAALEKARREERLSRSRFINRVLAEKLQVSENDAEGE